MSLEIHYPDLPIVPYKKEILEALSKHQVLIVAGETGSGKSTQLPKMCLEWLQDKGVIGHTQPRRIAARAVAERVAEELKEPLGVRVGYKIRFNDVTKPETRIKIMTDGILLNEIQFDRLLKQYQILIIDEAHERSLNIDLLLGFIKRLLPKRPDLKVIITSATIALEPFSKFFNDAPILQFEGKTYPVEIDYLPRKETEDYFAHLVRAIEQVIAHGPGDILVFLTGEGEIHLAQKILKQKHFKNTEVLELYARMSLNDQRKIFKPSGLRRIILSTNVAETSLTVPNIHYVVDSGFARISRYSHRSKIQRLPIEAISQASCLQRLGRAGRIAKGVCVRMYDEEDFLQRKPFTEPEIQRTNLAGVLLQMALLKLGYLETFPLLDLPDPKLIRDGLNQLERLQALTEEQRLTPLGKQMARLPIEPKLAKILLKAHELHALEEALVIVSALSIQDPRQYPKEFQPQAQAEHAKYEHPKSNFLSFMLLWEHLHGLKANLSINKFREHCRQHYLSYTRILEWMDVYQQLKSLCRHLKLGFHEKPATYEEVHIALLSGLFENIGIYAEEEKNYHGPRGLKFSLSKNALKKPPKWVMVFHFIETNKVYGFCAAEIEPKWILRVAPHLCKSQLSELFWDAKSGFVKAYARVSFFGLTVVAKKAVSIESKLQNEARDVFIRDALMNEAPLPFAFWQHQEEVIAKVHDLEARIRKPNFYYHDEKVVSFYQNQLSDDVYSIPALQKWLKTHDEKQLYLPLDLFVEKYKFNELLELYPDTYEIEELSLPLRYVFDLGSEEDGVSIEIPSACLNLIQHHDFSWGLKGQCEEKLEWLLNKLPKMVRVKLPTLKQCLSDLSFLDKTKPLIDAFKEALMQRYQVQVPLQILAQIEWPLHLRFLFKIVSNHEVIAKGRDLDALLKDTLRAQEAPVGFMKEGSFSSWTMGDIPKSIQQSVHGQTITLYPALVDKGFHVNLENFATRELAHEQHGPGLTRLYMLSEAKRLQTLKKQIPGLQTLKKLCKSTDLSEQVMDDLLWLTFNQSLVENKDDIFTKQAFDANLQKHGPEIMAKANTLTQLVLSILEANLAFQPKLLRLHREKASLFPESYQDIVNQRDNLFYERFLREVPFEWLQRYPMYLKALNLRVDRFFENPIADDKLFKELKPLLAAFKKICENRDTLECKRVRWLLEEYRLSLFAQPLKPKIPVSKKKILQWLNELA